MNRYLEAVREFHEVFNHPVNNYKNDIPLKLRQLRIKLIFEELEELAKASDCMETFDKLCLASQLEYGDDKLLKEQDIQGEIFMVSSGVNKKEELDALGDLQVVLSGAVLALGYQDVFDEAFEEVQRSNMSKMCHTLEEVEATIKYYKETRDVESYSIEKDGGWIVLRKDDDKILKNVNYSEANLHQFIQ